MDNVSTTTEQLVQQPRTRADFHRLGISVTQWARERGYSPHLVYSVLSGTRKCLRGQSHQIARELGMK